MRINATVAPPEQCPEEVNPVIAYAEWRLSCTSVWAAYRQWSNAPKPDANLAYAAYTAALDREDAAAGIYSRVTKRRTRRGRATRTWF